MLALVHLLHRVRDAASPAELAFLAVNETATLVPYRQAALWEEGRGVTAISGVPTQAGTDRHRPSGRQRR